MEYLEEIYPSPSMLRRDAGATCADSRHRSGCQRDLHGAGANARCTRIQQHFSFIPDWSSIGKSAKRWQPLVDQLLDQLEERIGDQSFWRARVPQSPIARSLR